MIERRVTLRDVAQRTGVSVTTISKVLNGGGDVSPQTRALVEEHLDRSGYRRRLPQVGTGYIQIVVPGLTGDWVFGIVSGVHDAAARAGHGVAVVVNDDRDGGDPGWVDEALRRSAVAVVVLVDAVPEAARARLRARGIPFLLIDPSGDPTPDVPAVSSANWSGGLEAARHLLGLGHRRIAALTGPATSLPAIARVDGFRAAMTSAGVAVREDWVRFGGFTAESGEREARALLADPDDRPTAIFAGSDMQAVGVLDAAAAAGVAVPRDLSVVGFDDLTLSRYVRPRLTTIRQPLREMAAQATKTVLELVDHPNLERPRIELSTRLVVRESTAQPSR
ncbi:LacI family DNA-binding transcriptional regulator [Microbacterium invictum]|uniref:LacI family DNA-binding transcriptional regulator n=1 Tax=Microbacterium invictum TaxID=515415 RepID=A0ABZ0VBE5_9MICO|nr:LacI family DNA-binding transcriptional regulator [Microbacterium invictum]WQB70799.1 LacI family DNA-binding transcriptional regulator [Microbacterium invictum]